MSECEHLHVIIRWKLYAMETRYCPAEYVGKAECLDCGEIMDPDDVPEDAEVEDVRV